MKLPEEERKAYENYQEDLHYQASMFQSSFGEGYFEGKAEGKAEGKQEVALRLIAKGMTLAEVAEITGISEILLQR